ncbi:MAG: glycosyltransferase family 9 protein [Crocinitomicaceae bacterium]|nr:glycosyltransferase family 9 protein [Crocinitomicaceae bacterium]
MKKILIIQTAFLGDVILATPVISEMARIYPACKIDVLVRKGNESLLKNNPFINDVFVFDKQKGKYSSILKLIKQFRTHKYDEIINLQRFASSGLITVLSGAKATIGFNKNPFSFLFTKKVKHLMDNRHEVERNLECIKHHGANTIRKPELFPADSDYQKVFPFQQHGAYFCLAPASVWFTKQLPFDKWVTLGKILSKKGKVYLLGGKEDRVLCEEIRAEIDSENCLNLAGELNLLQSAALIKSAQRNYVNDSGPMHICSAMNAPVTTFYCSTIPAFGFGPLSDDSKINQIQENLYCRPCGIHGFKSCPEKHFRCGHEIILDEE